MTNTYIGLNRGADQSPDQVAEGSSTQSTDVELRIDNSKSLTRLEIILIVQALERYIEDGRVTVLPL